MKKITANYIFPGNSSSIKNGVIIVDNNGVIIDLLNPEFDEINWAEVEKHEGIICPGFINTHCHLELSHLKGKIEEDTQLHGFVRELVAKRNPSSLEIKLKAIALADEEMKANGIVAVGDISNGTSTFAQKERSAIMYHSFIEVFGLNPNQAKSALIRARHLKKEYHNKHITITPHAPYSLTAELVKLVNDEKESILSIHNQETESENELFEKGTGPLFDQMNRFDQLIQKWEPTGKSSLKSYLQKYSNDKRMLLVHNTFTNKEDIEFANGYSRNIYWCFCPNANEYIERRQPDYGLFLDQKCTIGTDSLASNWSLSILDELKTIVKKDKTIGLETLIKWATCNGAEFLGFDKLGSIEKGKSPGLNLIKNIDLTNLCLTEKSVVTVL